MDAGNEGVDEEHENHHGQDGHALHQQNLVGYSVLLGGGEKCALLSADCLRLSWVKWRRGGQHHYWDTINAAQPPWAEGWVWAQVWTNTFFCSSWMFCSQFLSSWEICLSKTKHNKTKMYSVLFLCHHLDPTEPWLLIITKPVCKTDLQTSAGCRPVLYYVLRVVFLYLLLLLNCVFVIKINETKREIYMKCLCVFFEKI